MTFKFNLKQEVLACGEKAEIVKQNSNKGNEDSYVVRHVYEDGSTSEAEYSESALTPIGKAG